LRRKIRETAEQHPTYGCPRITVLIRREGSNINPKRIHRLWKEEGLQSPRRRPKKYYVGPKGEVKQKAEYPNHVWSYDFLEDRAEKGNKLRFLTVLDEFTREALALPVQPSSPPKMSSPRWNGSPRNGACQLISVATMVLSLSPRLSRLGLNNIK
jgi:putative transposase